MRLQPAGRVFIAGTGRSVRARDLLTNPQLCALAAEAIAWEFERRDWQAHRPARRHRRARRSWVAAGRQLDDRRSRLEALATAHGL